jgi:hypothetical protein
MWPSATKGGTMASQFPNPSFNYEVTNTMQEYTLTQFKELSSLGYIEKVTEHQTLHSTHAPINLPHRHESNEIYELL